MRVLWGVLASLTATTVVAGSTSAMAASAPGAGSVRVTINTPAAVPANVGLDNKATGTPDGFIDHVAAKAASGTSQVVTLSVPASTYHVALPAITFAGTRYAGAASAPEVVVRTGQTSSLNVTYTAEPGARGLQLTALTSTSVGLSWSAPAGSKFALRRSVGDTAVTQMTQGAAVPVTGSTATDSGLTPGTTYTYSLFTQGKNNARWYGPLAVVVSTATTGATQASYVASPTTLIAQAGDIVSAAPTGSGVQVQLGAKVPTPLLGSAMVLPRSQSLPGGFLGVVSSISANGRGVTLSSGGLSDAFEYYNVRMEDFGQTVGPQPVEAPVSAASQPTRQERAEAVQAAALPAALVKCFDASGVQEVSFNPDIDLGGHLYTTVNKSGWFNLPKGASLDVAMTATLTGAFDVATGGTLNCKVPLAPYTASFSAGPVPMALVLDPVAQFTVGGKAGVQNLGFSATGGIQFNGTLDLTGGASFSSMPILEAHPLTPTITANAGIGAKLGGQVLFGPGVTSKGAGVVAGVSGELNVLDASFGPVFTVDDSRFNTCLTAAAAASVSVGVTAKAWLGNYDVTKSFLIPPLASAYPGSPWDRPTGCADQKPVDVGGDLLGEGVTAVEDDVQGSPAQWGHVDGFAPGKKTWVLSTGLIAEATGAPDFFASTALGGSGDAALSGLAGEDTHDAAAYQVVLKPTGDTLHVKYVFASEEYPEYVGSQFNDVMAVFVNGKNCATVPGTNTPVAINTINDESNASYYVNNADGAAGYSTSMDGLTVPLTCAVPVTPGEPVTVRIAVADSSDSEYDSAVALLDQGIWSD